MAADGNYTCFRHFVPERNIRAQAAGGHAIDSVEKYFSFKKSKSYSSLPILILVYSALVATPSKQARMYFSVKI